MFWLPIYRHLSKSQVESSGSLEILDELGTRQDGLGLLECLDLLIPGGLADLEVLHDEVAVLVELSVVVGKLLQLEESGLLVGDGLLHVLLGLGALLGLVHLGLGLLLNGGVGVLDEVLVCLLGLSLGAGGISLHLLGIIDDFLDHAHDTTGSTALLVLLESGRRRRALGLLLLDESLLLLVEALEDVQGSGQELLGGTLVCDNLLELLVLLLAVLTSTLQLSVELGNLGLEGIDLGGEGLDGELKVLNESKEILLLALLTLGLELVGVELLDAEVLVLDLVLLLSQELGDHVIDGF